MKKFEIGKEYFDRSACNYDCIFTIKIIKRTEKTVTFERHGKTRRAKLFCDDRGEYIIPDRYSMAPVFRAECEVQPEEEAPAAEESTVSALAEDVAPSNVVTISQPADDSTVIVMIGQRVNASAVPATLWRAERSSALKMSPTGGSSAAACSRGFAGTTARTTPNGSASPTFTAAAGGPRAAPRWACSWPDKQSGRRKPPQLQRMEESQ